MKVRVFRIPRELLSLAKNKSVRIFFILHDQHKENKQKGKMKRK
jgi:hypothetical protein